MIPIPKLLEKRLEFGNTKQIEAAKVYAEVEEEEKRAATLVNNCKAKFFLDGKLMFELLVGNEKVLEKLTIKIHKVNDELWRYDEIKQKTARRGVLKCQQI